MDLLRSTLVDIRYRGHRLFWDASGTNAGEEEEEEEEGGRSRKIRRRPPALTPFVPFIVLNIAGHMKAMTLAIFRIVLCATTLILLYEHALATTHAGLFHADDVAMESEHAPWVVALHYDAIVLTIACGTWMVGYKEKGNTKGQIGWTCGLLIFGGAAIVLYVAVESFRIVADEPFEAILFRRRDCPMRRNNVLEMDGKHPMTKHLGQGRDFSVSQTKREDAETTDFEAETEEEEKNKTNHSDLLDF